MTSLQISCLLCNKSAVDTQDLWCCAMCMKCTLWRRVVQRFCCRLMTHILLLFDQCETLSEKHDVQYYWMKRLKCAVETELRKKNWCHCPPLAFCAFMTCTMERCALSPDVSLNTVEVCVLQYCRNLLNIVPVTPEAWDYQGLLILWSVLHAFYYFGCFLMLFLILNQTVEFKRDVIINIVQP